MRSGAVRRISRLLAAALVMLGLLVGAAMAPAAGAATGDLTYQGCVAEAGASGCASGTGLGASHGAVVSPDGANLYVVGKPSGSGRVAEFQRDTTTGDISDIGCVAEGGADGCTTGYGLNEAAGIAISPDGNDVYVAAASSNSVVSFSRDSTGALTETGCLAETNAEGCTVAPGLNSATGITVSPDGQNVYVTSELSNAIDVFNRDPSTGELTYNSCFSENGVEGCTAAPGLSHAENVVVSPDNQEVYVTGYSSDSVVTFSRDTSTGNLTYASCIAEGGAEGCASGSGLNGADGIALSPDGSSLYVAAEDSSALVTFSRSSAGVLTEQGCTAEAAVDSCTVSAGLKGAARVVVSPDGSSVYAAGYTGNTLDTFTRASNGSLTAQGACLGQSGNGDGCTTEPGLAGPAGLAVSPDGANLYTATNTSNAVDSFMRSNGTVTPSGAASVPPGSMDALGDSFTQALYSGGSCAATAACPANSWATGTTASVNSQYERLLGLNPNLAGHEVNRAVSGRNMSYLDTEVKAAIPDNPAYMTIMMGLNDVCGATMTVSTMTPSSQFGSEFQTAMSDLTSNLPNVKVLVASIPNEYHLWQILHTNSSATSAWTSQQVCPTMLANPTSTAPADVSRRATVSQQIISDNSQLQQVCAQFTQCQFDNDAVYNWNFAPYDVDTSDYFHPSLQGQNDLARVTYQSGYAFTPGAQAPYAASSAATGVNSSSATLKGVVNPQGTDTTYYFQYGTGTTYGSSTPPQDAGSGTANQSVSASLSNLQPATPYHFRLVAQSTYGTTYGADQTFTTPAIQDAYFTAVQSDSPVSYWRFDEPSGTVANDQESQNPGTYKGKYTLGSPGALSDDPAVSFAGAGYVSVPHSTTLNTGDVFSLEAWVKPSKLKANEGIFSNGSYELFLNTLNQLELYRVGVGAIATSTSAITSTSNWHYVVATKSGASVHLYLDGTDVTGKVTNRTVVSSNSALMIGNGPTDFNGSLDEAAVYNHVLTPARVSAHFAAAQGAPPPQATTGSASGVSSGGATLNGSVNPEGAATSYWFQYGTGTGYGSTTASTPAGSGTGAQAESAPISNLAPNTPYHFRLVASSSNGTVYGADQTFSTQPTAGGGGSTSAYRQAVLGDQPVSYWRLDEQSGPTAADTQGLNPGTYTGGYTLGVPGATGDSDTAVSLDGSTGYVSIPYSAALNPASSWSVEAWVDPTQFSTGDDMSAVNSRLPTTLGRAGYDLGLSSSTGTPYVEVGGRSAYKTLAASTPVPLNAWTYLVATYDGSNLRLYENGTLVAGPTAVAYVPNPSVPLNLGDMDNGAAQFFPGGLDDAAVYASALSPTQIQNHFTAASGSSQSSAQVRRQVAKRGHGRLFTAPADHLRRHWRFHAIPVARPGSRAHHHPRGSRRGRHHRHGTRWSLRAGHRHRRV